MSSPAHALVYRSLARQMRIEEASIDDADLLAELGLDAIDLVLVVLRLQRLDAAHGDFHVEALAEPRAVGDFVALVDVWLHQDDRAGRARRRVRSCVVAI
jgi:hypothetical protein